MTRNWENEFSQWSRPPSRTENERCENAVKAVRNAISKSDKLKNRGLKVFTHGSYRNRVNVRQDSDIDVGVLCNESLFRFLPAGTTDETFGLVPATYHYGQFKGELEEALTEHFGYGAVHRGNKAIDVRENSYHVEADVAPFFEYRHYWEAEVTYAEWPYVLITADRSTTTPSIYSIAAQRSRSTLRTGPLKTKKPIVPTKASCGFSRNYATKWTRPPFLRRSRSLGF